jgi:DNA-binding NarL/FixJ family response regulator
MVQRLLMVEDHAALAEAIRFYLAASDRQVECVGVAHTVADALRLFEEHAPDTVLMDIELPDGDGIATIRRLKGLDPDVRVIVLTAHTSFDVLFATAEAGADLVLPKEAPMSELAAALEGERTLDLTERGFRAGETQFADTLSVPLTPRELEILHLLADGLSPKAIAVSLNISVHTTRGHIKNVLWKLGEHSQLGAVAAATRLGLLERSLGHAG